MSSLTASQELKRATALLITDSDLDGRGCGIVAQASLGEALGELEIIYTLPNKVNDVVRRLIDSNTLSNYDYVFMTDLSVDSELAEELDKMLHTPQLQHFQLLDHHKTALPLNDYPWALVELENESGDRSCGASLLLRHLTDEWNYVPSVEMEHLVETIRQYDTWEWYYVYSNIEAKHLNNLMSLYGPEDFDAKCLEYVKPGGTVPLITATDQAVLDVEQKRIDRYVDTLERSIIPVSIPYENYHVGFVYCEQYQSEAGNVLAKRHPEYDFIAMVDVRGKKVSLRTMKPDVDVSAVAKHYGGGGHLQAAGYPLTDMLYISLGVHLFNK